MSKDLTPEQEQTLKEYYEARAKPVKKRIKGLSIISIACGLAMLGFLWMMFSGDLFDEKLRMIMGTTMACLSVTSISLGIFSPIVFRSDDSLRSLSSILKIVANIFVIVNALCLLSSIREGGMIMVPLVGILISFSIVYFISKERTRLDLPSNPFKKPNESQGD